MNRCPWCGSDPLYVAYHDEEWGVPVHDEKKHFEFLVLESAQAGLSWITILRRREGYRLVFENFDPRKVSDFDENKVNELLGDSRIIRNRKKIEASIKNARQFIAVQKEFGTFDTYLWNFVDNKPLVNAWKDIKEIPPSTALSDRVSSDLKKRGFSFVGTTIIYAHLQAVGIVNDHLVGCFRYGEIKEIQ